MRKFPYVSYKSHEVAAEIVVELPTACHQIPGSIPQYCGYRYNTSAVGFSVEHTPVANSSGLLVQAHVSWSHPTAIGAKELAPTEYHLMLLEGEIRGDRLACSGVPQTNCFTALNSTVRHTHICLLH